MPNRKNRYLKSYSLFSFISSLVNNKLVHKKTRLGKSILVESKADLYSKPTKNHRRSIRLRNYDYSKEGTFFVTLCIQDKKKLFVEIMNIKMHLNSFGLIAAREWENTLNIRKNISLGEYIIKPDHLHGIIKIEYLIIKNGTASQTGTF